MASQAYAVAASASTASKTASCPVLAFRSHEYSLATSFLGGISLAMTSPESTNFRRTWLTGGVSVPGRPLCPHIQNVNFSGILNGAERRTPVSCSPFTMLSKNQASGFPSVELRCRTPQGLGVAALTSGIFSQGADRDCRGSSRVTVNFVAHLPSAVSADNRLPR